MPIQTYATYLARIRLQERLAPELILHFDMESQDLRNWLWCVAFLKLSAVF